MAMRCLGGMWTHGEATHGRHEEAWTGHAWAAWGRMRGCTSWDPSPLHRYALSYCTSSSRPLSSILGLYA
eukprot:365573-Chlamydomonas_euryale.AAC.10